MALHPYQDFSHLVKISGADPGERCHQNILVMETRYKVQFSQNRMGDYSQFLLWDANPPPRA